MMLKRNVLRLLQPSLSPQTYLKNNYSTKPEAKSAPMECNAAIRDAEKVVGYPTSFLNLRLLLSDEMANITTHIKKLVHVKHPLIDTAKESLFKADTPTFGLIVLLVAKTNELQNARQDIEIDRTAGILHSQRIVGEVTEMMRTSIVIHRSLLNCSDDQQSSHDLQFGNKLALLYGDYILSKCSHDLAEIKNQDVNNLISSTLRDLTENEFLGRCDEQNHPLPAPPRVPQSHLVNLIDDHDQGPYDVKTILGHSKPEWFLRTILGGANLLGKSCQAVCMLSQQDAQVQRNAFLLGKLMGCVWQLKMEVECFQRKEFGNHFLVGAPVLFALSAYPILYVEIERGVTSVRDCDYERIHALITVETNTLADCRAVQQTLMEQSMDCLQTLSDTPAKQSLIALLKSLKLPESGESNEDMHSI